MSDLPPQYHSSGAVHQVRWSEICPWLILVKALRASLLVRVLGFAALGVVCTQVGWLQISQRFSPELEMPARLRAELPTAQFADRSDRVLGHVRPSEWQSGTLVSGWYWLTSPAIELGNPAATASSLIGRFLMVVWAGVVWAFLGSAICRITAVYLTRGEILGPGQALREATTVWTAVIGAPFISLLSALAFVGPLAFLGVLLRSDYLAIVAAVLWLLVFALGLVLAVIVFGLLIGWPLMWACQSVERSDSFDGVSRCYAYVYQRPLHLVFFLIVAAGLGLLGDQALAFFVHLTGHLSDWVVSWGSGNQRALAVVYGDLESSPVPLATTLIGWWKWGFDVIALSYPVASLWSMSVGLYLLLRRLVDSTEMDEIVLVGSTSKGSLPTDESAELDDAGLDESQVITKPSSVE